MYHTPNRNRSFGPILLFLAVGGLAVLLAGLIGIGGGIYAAIFTIALVFAFLGILDYRICVIALIVMLPLSGTYFFPRKLFGLTGMNPFNVLLLFALLSFALAGIFSRKSTRQLIPNPSIFWPLVLALVVATFIGSRHIQQIPMFYRLESPELFETAAQYFRDVLIKPLLIFTFVWLLAAGVAKSKRLDGWIVAVIAGAGTIALLVLFFVALSGLSLGALSTTSARSFLSPTGMHANEIGIALIPAYSVCLFLFPSLRGAWARAGIAGAGFVLLIALLLTFSRAALLAVLIVTVVFVLKQRKPAWILGGAIVISVAILFAPQPVKDRVMRGFESGSVGARNDPLTAGRVGGIWKPLIPEIGRQPILGNGIHSTMWSNAARSGIIYVAHPHNAYLKLLLDFGVLLGAFVLYFLVKVWRLWRAAARSDLATPIEKAFFDGICVGFIAFLVQCMSGSTLVFEITHAVFLCAIGMALGVVAKRGLVEQKKVVKSRWLPPALLHANKRQDAWG